MKSDAESYSSTDESDQDEQDNQWLKNMIFLQENKIDFARAFLGKKGGYSIRDLKRFFRQSEIYSTLRRDAKGNLIPPNYEKGGRYDDEVDFEAAMEAEDQAGDNKRLEKIKKFKARIQELREKQEKLEKQQEQEENEEEDEE